MPVLLIDKYKICSNKYVAILISTFILFYAAVDGLCFRVNILQRISYASLLLFVLVCSVFFVFEKFVLNKTFVFFFISCLFVFFQGIFSYLFVGSGNLIWFATDSSIWLFLLCFVLFFSCCDERLKYRVFVFLIFYLFVVSLFVYFFGERVNGRFEAPPLVLVAGTALLALRGGKKGLVYALMFFAVGAECLASGERTAFLIWGGVGGGVLLMGCRTRLRHLISLFVFMLLICTFLLPLLDADEMFFVAEGSRFESLLDGRLDASLLSRINEGRDALEMLTVEESLLVWLFGFGHGAAYVPIESNIVRNINDVGIVHNIHIAPVLFLFRYGVVGLFFYFAFFSYSIAFLLKRAFFSPFVIDYRMLSSLSVVAYFASSFLRNEFVNPLFLFVLAMLFSSDRVHEMDL